MFIPNLPSPHQSVREVLGSGWLPDAITDIIVSSFWTVHEDRGGSDRELFWPGPSLLPGAPCVSSGYVTLPGAALPPGGRPVRNGAPVSIFVLRPGRPLLHVQASLRLLGRADQRGPPLQW